MVKSVYASQVINYATMFTSLLVLFVSLKEFDLYSVFALNFGILDATIQWRETIGV